MPSAKRFCLLALALLLLNLSACHRAIPSNTPEGGGLPVPNPLYVLAEEHPEWGEWTQDPSKYQAQIILTTIQRDAKGKASYKSHYWGHPVGEYFYPASTVKMPVAVLALQRLRELNINGLDAYTPMEHGIGQTPQTAAKVDSSAEGGLPTVANYLRKIFLVSDNDAYNRLYEWLGPAYINEQLQAKGLTNTRIIHRLSVSGFDAEGNRHLNPIRFYNESGTLYEREATYSKWESPLNPSGQQKGIGYYEGEKLVKKPFDFSTKNFVSLEDLHGIVMRLYLPAAFPKQQRFDLQPEDYVLLKTAMGQRPRESSFPAYPNQYDHYVKFWQFGDRDSSQQMPESIRIYNKVGWAYGYLTDAAYIVDTQAGVEYFLSGTIHVNEDRIFNDDAYEYESTGLPFFGQFGRAIHAWVLSQKR